MISILCSVLHDRSDRARQGRLLQRRSEAQHSSQSVRGTEASRPPNPRNNRHCRLASNPVSVSSVALALSQQCDSLHQTAVF